MEAAVFVGVLLLAGILLLITTLTGVLLLISSFPLVASLASVLLLVAFFLISFLLVSFLLVLRFVLALVAALPFILILALARRVQPRLPRDDERVLVGVLADLRAVQVVRGQIVLVVVRLRAERQGVVPVRPALSTDRGRGDGVRPQAEGFRAGTDASNCSKV